MKMLLLTAVLSFFVFACYGHTPVVIWHGMGDSCCNENSIGKIINVLQQQLDNVTVLSLQFGNSTLADIESGYFANANKQVEEACETIRHHADLTDGYNAIGLSQGGQFLRAVAQRCPSPPMKNLISLGGQHQGVYGLPRCGQPEPPFCDYIRKLLNEDAYIGWIQNSLIQAQYWHDPLDEDLYRNNSIFIADINNEKEVQNPSYIKNLQQLEKLVLVMFENDSMVAPRESSWFGFYAPGQAVDVLDYKDTDVYTQDKLGLKQLEKDNKLVLVSIPGDHLEFTLDWFTTDIIDKFLR